jgi:hypothetical protein
VKALIHKNSIKVVETGRSGVRKLKLIQDDELLRRLRGKKGQGVPPGETVLSRHGETSMSRNHGTIDKTNSNNTVYETKRAANGKSNIEIMLRQQYSHAPWSDAEFCRKIRRYASKGHLDACENVLEEFDIPLQGREQ